VGQLISGGHVIETAARDPKIAAVIAQAPFTDGLRNLPSLGLGLALRLTAAGLRDQLGAALGRPPYMVASVGAPGSLASRGRLRPGRHVPRCEPIRAASSTSTSEPDLIAQ
jgi:hypothetical protein